MDGLDDKLDGIRKDILHMQPFPTVEHAYGHVRRESTCQAVMIGTKADETQGAVLASKSLKIGTSTSAQKGKSNLKKNTDGQKCTHCGGSKHTWETGKEET
ncbi:conserved hypothetical protein [Ricinus communis]|uniref:Uncharacterized protein n=1 Tax=Ricinus communis TaxID=3988 RepID=B9T0E2_RICCO|nr:conserved hypothetical protein [Ricinus communis]